jgi:hypothetical protein
MKQLSLSSTLSSNATPQTKTYLRGPRYGEGSV